MFSIKGIRLPGIGLFAATLFLPSVLLASVETIAPYYRFDDLIPLFNGRPVLSVSSVCQDIQGFLWVGTSQGVFRYDGNVFARFGFEKGRDDSLSQDDVFPVFPGRDGAIWIGTNGGGLNRFDPETETFRRFRLVPSAAAASAADIVLSIAEDGQGRIWAGTRGAGLFRLDPASGRSEAIPLGSESDKPLSVFALRADRSGFVWVGTHGAGLFRIDPSDSSVRRFRGDPSNPRGLGDDRIWAFAEDREGRLWIGTSGSGIYRFDGEAAGFARFPGILDGPYGLKARPVTALAEDHLGRIWIGTSGDGLRVFDPKTSRFDAYRHDPGDPDSLSDNSVTSLRVDQSGLLWVGTTGGSLSKTVHEVAPFRHFRDTPSPSPGLTARDVRALWAGKNELWMGTTSGLDRVESGETAYGGPSLGPLKRLSGLDVSVRAIAEDREGGYWIGTEEAGLIRLGKNAAITRRFRAVPGSKEGLSSDRITSVVASRSGRPAIWVGTEGGLDRIDPLTNRVDHFRRRTGGPEELGDNHVRALAESRDGIIWVGTSSRGLYSLDSRTEKIKSYPPEAEAGPARGPVHRSITTIFVDQKGGLWIGTGVGISHYDRTGDRWTTIAESRGLPGGSVRAFLEDLGGRIWVSTERGLARIDPSSGLIRAFGLEDGLQAEEFNEGAAVSDSSGRLYFGGPNGLNALDPARPLPLSSPHIVLTGFLRSGRPVRTGPALPHRTFLDFRTNEFVVLQFSSLNFRESGRVRFVYRLEGRDRDWIETGPRREIEFSKLKSGRHNLQVGAIDPEGGTIEPSAVWTLRVSPPLARRPWFWLAIFVVLAVALRAVFRKRAPAPLPSFLRDEEFVLKSVVEKYRISEREREILKLVLGGKTNDEISAVLFISPTTVRNHVSNIYQKLQVRSRIQLLNLLRTHAGKTPGV